MNRKSGHMPVILRCRVRANTGEDLHARSSRSTRRALLIAAAAWPLVSWANAVRAQSKQPVLVGWLHSGPRKANGQYLAVLKEGMAALGWKEGAQFVVEERWADGQ